VISKLIAMVSRFPCSKANGSNESELDTIYSQKFLPLRPIRIEVEPFTLFMNNGTYYDEDKSKYTCRCENLILRNICNLSLLTL
jgi:hypothetical protein